jgi:hypothetical protein
VSGAPSDATQGGARVDPFAEQPFDGIIDAGIFRTVVIKKRKWHARGKDARTHARHPAHR